MNKKIDNIRSFNFVIPDKPPDLEVQNISGEIFMMYG
jgi:hypothetical protein